MMIDPDNHTNKLVSSAIKYIVGGLATLLASALFTFFRHFVTPVHQSIKTSVPKDNLVQMVWILFLACVLLLIWIILLNNERRKPLADQYDFDEYGGYYLDPKNGRAICPSCLAEGKVVHMMNVQGNKMCNACQTVCRGKAEPLDDKQSPPELLKRDVRQNNNQRLL